MLDACAQWRQLLYGHRARPMSLLRGELCDNTEPFVAALRAQLALDAYGREQWCARFSDAGAKLSDFVVDDALEAFSHTAPSAVCVLRCTWLFERLVPVARGTAGADTTRFEAALRPAGVGEWLRGGGGGGESRRAPLIVVPVVRNDHFWLYILNVRTETLEYYDSAPASMRTGRRSRAPLRSLDAYLRHIERARGGDDDDHALGTDDDGADADSGDDDDRLALAEHALAWYARRHCDIAALRTVDMTRTVQQNATDCGVFVCMYAYLRLCAGLDYVRSVRHVQQAHVAAFRDFMCRAAVRV